MAREVMMVPTKEYESLVGYYKGKINESTLLNKAGRLAAERELILRDPHLPDSVALAMAKPKGREARKLTKRIRRGVTSSSTAGTGRVENIDDENDATLRSPLENALKRILKMAEKSTVAAAPVTKRCKLPLTPQPALKLPKSSPGSPSGTVKKSGLGQSLKKGFYRGLSKYIKGGKRSTSPDDSDSEESDHGGAKAQKPKTPREVKSLRPEPGWDDWYEGRKPRRHLLQEFEASQTSSDSDDTGKRRTRRRKKKE